MPQDIANIQRDLANLQRQIKQMTDRAKKETDPKRKADLQKKIIDMNLKRSDLDKEMEDAVADMHAGSELQFAEGFTKWNKYKETKMKKLTEEEKLKIKKFAKGLVEKKLIKEATPSSADTRIIHINLKLTQQEYSELIGAIWDKHSSATGTAKKEILRSLKDKFEKYYK